MGRPKSSKTAISRIFDSADLPIFLLDSDRQIVYCNPACARWRGVDSSEELIGRRCDYHSLPTPGEADTAGMCPPPDAFHGQISKMTIEFSNDTKLAHVLPIRIDGTSDYHVLVFTVPISMDETRTLPQWHELVRVTRKELRNFYAFDRLVGVSDAARLIRRQVRAAASARANAFVIGPRGSGRETVARSIHYLTSNDGQEAALLPLACDLLDYDLLSRMIEAFSNRSEDTTDEQSTLLLLDVDKLPLDAQSALADFLVTRDSLHLLATSEILPKQGMADGQFDSRLAGRIGTIVIEIPPLRDRVEDIPILTQAAIERSNASRVKQIVGAEPAALEQLMFYRWPEEVDELFRVIDQAHEQADGSEIRASDLPEIITLARDAELHARADLQPLKLDEFLEEIEAELIRRALSQTRQNKTKAAHLLGISRARLIRRIEHLLTDVTPPKSSDGGPSPS